MLNRASEHSRVWKHYNAFYRNAGEVNEVLCEVCETVCEVQRSQSGPTGFASAMARQKVVHDYFTCPHNDEQWHWEALAMVQELEDTSSPTLRAIIKQDIEHEVCDGLKC
jgi:ribosomal protein S10